MVQVDWSAGVEDGAGGLPSSRESGLTLHSSTMLNRLLKSSALILISVHNEYFESVWELLCWCKLVCLNIPELSIFSLFQINPLLLRFVQGVPLFTPAVTKTNSSSVDDPWSVTVWVLCFTTQTGSFLTCRSKVHGIRQNPRGSSASAAKSHLTLSSPEIWGDIKVISNNIIVEMRYEM